LGMNFSTLGNGDVFGSLDIDYEAFEKDIAKVEIYFKSATATKIYREPTMTWIDFFANLGGLFGLVLGLGIIFLFEFVWFVYCSILNTLLLN
jgi:hypothetical protein